MAKKKLVIKFIPMKIESGPDVGYSPRVDYAMVEPDTAGEQVFELFDAHMLAFVKEHFIELNKSRFTFTIVPHDMKQWSRVFVESRTA